MIGIHTHLLPNGKVLSWEGHNDDNHVAIPGRVTTLSHAYEWNPNPYARNGSQVYPQVYNHFDTDYSNIFCSGYSFLANGQLLVVGRHYSAGRVFRNDDKGYNPRLHVNTLGDDDYVPPGTGDVNGYIGLRDANLFDYTATGNSTSPWRPSVPPMKYRRWYPTATTLSNGDVLVVAGQRYGGPTTGGPAVQAEIPEVYNAAAVSTGALWWRQLPTAARELPLYPWMFQAPDGRVFNAGPNADAKFLNPTAAPIGSTAAGTWDGTTYLTRLGLTNGLQAGARGYGTAVMYAPGKILVLGGASSTVTNTTELIDINTPATAQFREAAPMLFPRTHVNATILPDGSVLATGGSQTKTADDEDGVLYAELWQPGSAYNPGGTWNLMSEMSVPRLYHSTAVLLPDATVLTTGGGQGAGYTDHPTYQIFTPPYLCKGLARPEISLAPQAVAYGQTFNVSSLSASSIVGKGGRVTLVRLSSVTHSFNMNQRFLALTPTYGASSNNISLTAPSNPNLCPPGHYMLFLIDSNGTPSHASIIAINSSACVSPLIITQSNPNQAGSYNSCSRTTIFTVSGGPPNATYSWTLNGVSATSTVSSPATLEVPTSVSAPTAQVTVALSSSPDCGVSSTLTSYFPNCSEAN